MIFVHDVAQICSVSRYNMLKTQKAVFNEQLVQRQVKLSSRPVIHASAINCN